MMLILRHLFLPVGNGIWRGGRVQARWPADIQALRARRATVWAGVCPDGHISGHGSS